MAKSPPTPFTIPTIAGQGHDYNLERALREGARAVNMVTANQGTLLDKVAALPAPLTLSQIAAGLSASGSHPLNMTGLVGAGGHPPATGSPSAPAGAPEGPPPDPGTLQCRLDLPAAHPAGIPTATLRWMRGNMCGVHIPGLPAVPGGAADPTLVLSWFYDRYSPSDRAQIRTAWHNWGYTHVLLSWPDSRDFGTSIANYVLLSEELANDGFWPLHFLSSKDHDPADVAVIMAGLAPLFTALQATGMIPLACVGWELSLWLSPTQVQQLIDQMAAILVPATLLYVHFQQDYIAFQQPGQFTSAFWIANVNKLTGLLHQKELSQDCGLYQARIDDGLTRFSGTNGYPTDSGFGHPFDYVVCEVTAAQQFSGAMNQAAGDHVGFEGLCALAQTGPGGTVAVSGYMNGAADLANHGI